MMASGIVRRLPFSTAVRGKKIEFFYDIISPYTWFAFEVLMRYKKHWNVDIQLKPVMLGGITKATGNSAPLLVPNKALYMIQDLSRCAKYFDVPLNIIQDPFELMMVKGSLVPSRFLTAVDLLFPSHLEALSRALWMEAWNKDQDITSAEVLARAGLKVGLSVDQMKEVKELMATQPAKDRLRAYTDLVVNYGGFGLPTIVAHINGEPKLFFGSDRFPVLAQEIGETWSGPNPGSPNSKL